MRTATLQTAPNAPAANVKSGGWSKTEFLQGVFRAGDFSIPAGGHNRSCGAQHVSWTVLRPGGSSLSKRFVVTERLSAHVRADAFNVLNRANRISGNGSEQQQLRAFDFDPDPASDADWSANRDELF